ncbi:MAG: hypothetical protein AB8H80_15510 [Planctomycetota bacterium]
MFLRPKHQRLHVPDLWAIEDQGPDYEAARSFMLFLHRQGHLKGFVTALRDADAAAISDGRAELEDLTGKTLAQLDADWHAWIQATPHEIGGDTQLVQRAMILPRAEWLQWREQNAARLVFDEQLSRWRVRP